MVQENDLEDGVEASVQGILRAGEALVRQRAEKEDLFDVDLELRTEGELVHDIAAKKPCSCHETARASIESAPALALIRVYSEQECRDKFDSSREACLDCDGQLVAGRFHPRVEAPLEGPW